MSEKLFTTGRAKAIEQLGKELEAGYGAGYHIPCSETGEPMANALGMGTATGGTATTLVDTTKIYEADLFNDTIIKMTIGGKDYYRKVTDTADSTLTFAALPGTVVPIAGTPYEIVKRVAANDAALQALLQALIGEVQASPTTYTLLARIKALSDKIDSVINASDQVQIDAGSITAIIGEIEGMDAEAEAVTGKPLTIGYKDGDGNAAGVSPSNALPVQLSGSNMELYGASLDDRPDATTVPIGTTFTIVDDTHDFKTWMSNGVGWGEEI